MSDSSPKNDSVRFNVTLDAQFITELLDGIDGARECAQQATERLDRGEFIALKDFQDLKEEQIDV